MEITGPSAAIYEPNYKTMHTRAGVCFSYRSLHRVTTQKNRTVKADLPKTAAVDSGAEADGYINYLYVP